MISTFLVVAKFFVVIDNEEGLHSHSALVYCSNLLAHHKLVKVQFIKFIQRQNQQTKV